MKKVRAGHRMNVISRVKIVSCEAKLGRISAWKYWGKRYFSARNTSCSATPSSAKYIEQACVAAHSRPAACRSSHRLPCVEQDSARQAGVVWYWVVIGRHETADRLWSGTPARRELRWAGQLVRLQRAERLGGRCQRIAAGGAGAAASLGLFWAGDSLMRETRACGRVSGPEMAKARRPRTNCSPPGSVSVRHPRHRSLGGIAPERLQR
jgi:hypothetical protein